MLQVDPDQRISISGIKHHPAFSIGVSKIYIYPTPLPLPLLTDPVDPSNLQDSVLKNLQRIGFTNMDELINDLSSKEHTMAKVFHFMLTNRTSLAQLPWDSAHHSSTINTDFPSMKSITNISYEFSSELSDEETKIDSELFSSIALAENVIRQKPISFGIREPVRYSLIKKPNWLLDSSSQIEFQQEEEFHGFSISLIDIFQNLQQWVQKKGYKWFYPDDFRMICKTQSKSYLSLDCDYGDDKLLLLLIRLERGTQEEFDEIISELKDIFADKYKGENSLNDSDNDEQEIDEDY